MNETGMADTVPTSLTEKYTLPPMSIGRLLDRAIRLTPGLFKALLMLFIIQTLATVATNMPLDGALFAVNAIGTLVSIGLGLYLLVAVPLLAAEHWRGDATSLKAVEGKVSAKLIARAVLLSFRVGFVGVLLCFLFLIPGLIYFVNRALSLYILIVDECSISEALAKSKKLMLGEPWYKLGSPWTRFSAITLLLLILRITVGAFTLGSMAYFDASDSSYLLMLGSALFIYSLVEMFVYSFTAMIYVAFFYDLLARYEASDLLSEIEHLSVG